MIKLVFRARVSEFPQALDLINAETPTTQGVKTPVGQTEQGNFFDLTGLKVTAFKAYQIGGQVVISAEVATRQRAAAGCGQVQKLFKKLTGPKNRWQMELYRNPNSTVVAGRERSNATDRDGNLRPIVPVSL